jgi:hypothetical protein
MLAMLVRYEGGAQQILIQAKPEPENIGLV